NTAKRERNSVGGSGQNTLTIKAKSPDPVTEQQSLEAPLTESQPAPAANPLDLASAAMTAGKFLDAVALAQREVATKPRQAYRIIGAAACSLGDSELAGNAVRHLMGSNANYVVAVCSLHGTTLSP